MEVVVIKLNSSVMLQRDTSMDNCNIALTLALEVTFNAREHTMNLSSISPHHNPSLSSISA